MTGVVIAGSEELLIRTWRTTDAENWLKVSQSSGLNNFSVDPSYYKMNSLADAEAFIQKWMRCAECSGLVVMPICLRKTGEIIGICGLKPIKLEGEAHSRVDIMYRISEKHWGFGYGETAARLLLQHGFDFLKLKEIIGLVDPDNRYSKLILQKIGFRFVTCFLKAGTPMELYIKACH